MEPFPLPNGYARRIPLDLDSPCWPWPGNLNELGYGRVMVDNATKYVHDLTNPANVKTSKDGRRRCRICAVEGLRAWRAEPSKR